MSGCVRRSFHAESTVNTVVAELDSFTNDLVKKVESAPTSAGVDDAQKYLDSKKADLTAKIATLKDIRGYQVSEDTKKDDDEQHD